MYATSKLALIVFAYELQRRLKAEGSDIIVTATTPGFVATQILSADRTAPSKAQHIPLAVSPARGADTALHAALAAPAPPGTWCIPFFAPLRVGWLRVLPWLAEFVQRLSWGPRFAPSSPETYDAGLARDLWAFAEQVVGLQAAR
jgi:NAD(P)-dependent dehydrogenase (short-subunit alcohol dehydrogenase family)